MPEDDGLRHENKYLRKEIERLERDSFRLELDQLNHKGRFWHSHQGLFLYAAGALALLLIGSFFNKDVDLGHTGQSIVLMLIIGCLGYYWLRQKEDQTNWKRQRELEEAIEGKRDLPRPVHPEQG
jgi:hypothetical protein